MVVHACSPSYLGGWGRRIAWTWEAEVAVSRDCTTALLPGDRARLCLKKKRRKRFLSTNPCTLNSPQLHTRCDVTGRRRINAFQRLNWELEILNICMLVAAGRNERREKEKISAEQGTNMSTTGLFKTHFACQTENPSWGPQIIITYTSLYFLRKVF